MSLRPIMLTRPPVEIMINEGFWDELIEAGFRDVCVSWMTFLNEVEGGEPLPSHEEARPRVLSFFDNKCGTYEYIPVISPNNELYDGLNLLPPHRSNEYDSLFNDLYSAFEQAKSKGMNLYLFDDKSYFEEVGYPANEDGSRGFRCWNDPEVADYLISRTRDYSNQLPMFSGIVLDGPDYKWEIAPGERDDLFAEQCTCRHCVNAANEMGLDLLEMIGALDSFKLELQQLDDERVEGFLLTTRGFLGAVDWWLSHPDLLNLLRFKYSTIEDHLERVYEGIKKYLPEYQVMASSRTPSYISLTGHALPRRVGYTDFQLPKLYLWAGNQPGFRYTVKNYVDTISAWNPNLSKKNVVALTERILGIEFPEDYPVERFNDPAPSSFYKEIAGDEMKKMIHLVKDPDKLIPFIAVEHFGGPQIEPREVRDLLTSLEESGISRYIFFHYGVIADPVWDVLTEFAE